MVEEVLRFWYFLPSPATSPLPPAPRDELQIKRNNHLRCVMCLGPTLLIIIEAAYTCFHCLLCLHARWTFDKKQPFALCDVSRSNPVDNHQNYPCWSIFDIWVPSQPKLSVLIKHLMIFIPWGPQDFYANQWYHLCFKGLRSRPLYLSLSQFPPPPTSSWIPIPLNNF